MTAVRIVGFGLVMSTARRGIAPSVIEGIDMDSVPKCQISDGCDNPAGCFAATAPCGHGILACAEHGAQLLRWASVAGLLGLICHKCKAPLADPYFTVRPL